MITERMIGSRLVQLFKAEERDALRFCSRFGLYQKAKSLRAPE